MLRKAFALTEEGYACLKKGAAACALANLALMAPVMVLYVCTEAFLGHLVDSAAALPGLAPYLAAVAAVLVVLFLTQLFEYDNTYSIVYAESARKRIFIAERLRRLPLSFFGKRDLSDLTAVIMKDCADQERIFSHIIPQLIGAGISTIVVAVMLLAFDWRLGLAALWPIPVAVCAMVLSTRYQDRGIRMKNDATLSYIDGLQEYIECAREIRSTNRMEAALSDLRERARRIERAKFACEIGVGVVVSSSQAFLRLGLATTVLVGSSLMLAGSTSLVVFFAYLLVVTRLYDPASVILASTAELIDLRHNLARMRAIEEQPIQEGALSFDPAGHDIEFSHVTFSYADDLGTVLEDVSFTAKEGEVTALVGPSGGGKSTVAKLAARFWDVEGGRVLVGGIDISTIDPETLLADYAEVFQEVVLFDASVMENIRLGKMDATDEEVRAAAAAAMCDEFVERLPQGYDTPIGENGSRLSGGERQRISIARALLKDAPIVLLDEATASLDVENETQIQAALCELLRGKTVLVIAHRMRTVENADKVVVLSRGRVVEQGRPADLLAKNGMFARMVSLQKDAAGWGL